MSPSPNQYAGRVDRGKGRWKTLCRRPVFWLMVCIISLILFIWPFIPSNRPWMGRDQYLFLFCVWALIILVIAVISAGLPPFRQKPGGPDSG